MIKMDSIEGRACPRFYCDHCDKLIEEHGNIEWRHNIATGVAASQLYATHKSFLCSEGLQHSYPPQDDEVWMSQELSAFIAYLIKNTKIDAAAKWQEQVKAIASA